MPRSITRPTINDHGDGAALGKLNAMGKIAVDHMDEETMDFMDKQTPNPRRVHAVHQVHAVQLSGACCRLF
jgi:hypothetical protein